MARNHLIIGILHSTIICLLSAMPFIACNASSVNIDTLIKVKALLDSPATWGNIPKQITLCYIPFAGNIQNNSKHLQQEIEAFKALGASDGIQFEVVPLTPNQVQTKITSRMLNKSSTTIINFKQYTTATSATHDANLNKCAGLDIDKNHPKSLNYIMSLVLNNKQLEVSDPAAINFDAGTLTRVKALMEKPATWDKIPKEVKFCYFAIDSSVNSPTYKYAMQFMSESAKYKEIAKLGGIDLNITFTPPYRMRIDLASQRLKRKASTTIQFKPYTDERIVTEDFKSGACDGVAISNMRARQFNGFIGSLDAIGGVPSYAHLTEVIKTLSRGELGQLMINKDYEVTGIFPLGAAYIMVNDRRITSPAKAAGKRMAVLDFDKSQAKMVQRMGVQPVAAEVSNYGGKFNNGQVDIIAGPAILFNPLELHKGMEDATGKVTGGIIKFPLMQITGVVMMHRKTFPDGLGQLMREYSSQQLDFAYNFISSIENAVPRKYWVELPAADKPGYVKLMREARIAMTHDGFYDKRMMTLLKRVRCKFDPSNYECTMDEE